MLKLVHYFGRQSSHVDIWLCQWLIGREMRWETFHRRLIDIAMDDQQRDHPPYDELEEPEPPEATFAINGRINVWNED
jgi:hypothetical protein